MTVPPSSGPDDETLARFILGTLPEEEAEPLEELSIVDDGFAARVSAVENDLIDRYVRGQLPGSMHERFESRYLSSPSGLEKIRFAASLARTIDTRSGAVSRLRAPVKAPTRLRGIGRLDSPWMLAAAATIVLAAGYLAAENLRLRRELADLRASTTLVEQRAQQLTAELNERRSTDTEFQKELARLQEAVAQLRQRDGDTRQPAIATYLLTPETRGSGSNVDIRLAPDATVVRLQMPLKDDGFREYEARIIDSSTDAEIWRSPPLTARSMGNKKAVSATVPATALKADQFSLDLFGVAASGQSDLLDSYTFRIVRP